MEVKNLEKSPEKQEIQDERIKTYLEPKTQNLLRELIRNGDNTHIVPVYDPNLGFIYKEVEQTFGNETSPDKVLAFLNKLTRLDILEKSFFDTISACPKCESTALTLHYYCPKCKNHNVIKTNLTEHILCGLIDERIKFLDDVCPRCGENLEIGNHRNMGRWYLCRNCEEKTVKPGLKMQCRKCNKDFSIEESKLLEISKFSLNPDRRNEIKQRVASFDKIIKMLQDLDFEVEVPGYITGQKSGMKHHFTLIAKRPVEDEEFVLTLDHTVWGTEIKSSAVIVYVYKISEIRVDIPVFLGINKISEEAKKIAKGHNVLLIEGSPENEQTIEQIKTQVEQKISNKKSKHLQIIAADEKIDDNKKKPNSKINSEMKPQLFSVVTSIHQKEKGDKKRNFKGFFKKLGRNGEKKTV